MAERSRKLAFHVARAGAVVLALAVLTHLVVRAHERANPAQSGAAPSGVAEPGSIASPAPSSFSGGTGSSGSPLIVDVQSFTDPSVAATIPPAVVPAPPGASFLYSSKSMVIDEKAQDELDRLLHLIRRGSVEQPGKSPKEEAKKDPVFLPSSKFGRYPNN